MASYTDIIADGWVARLPQGWRPYALLARLDRLIGVWLLFLPGLWSILLARAPLLHSAYLVALFCVGAVLMRSAGCVVNDMWDRELDRLVTRTASRPLASGVLRMRHAAIFLVALLSLSLLILLQLSPLAQLLGVASLALVAVYPLAKRITWWPQAMLGLTFGWGAPMGFAAASGHMAAQGLVLYAATFFWILGYDTIYAHQDREDDALVGIKSTARLFGAHSGAFLAVCYAATAVLFMVAGALAQLSAWALLAFVPALWLLLRQVRGLAIDDPAHCLALFKSNRDVGLLIGLAILLGRM